MAPYFSVIVTTFERERIVRRCVDSCLNQTWEDFEVVVVDDASRDGTVAALEAYDDPRLRVVVHDGNRGINPARHSGVAAARGEWVVVVDSDWELLPGSLERLAEVIDGLPEGVGVVRSRLRWDDDSVTPTGMPDGAIEYVERIEWIEREGPQDAGRCIRRSVFERTPYIDGRRGALEALYELDLAKNETAYCIDDVLGLEHTDSDNSWLRSVNSAELIPRLYAEAPDMLWMAETTLERHGEALRRHGPDQYMAMVRIAALQAFLLGRRREGICYSAEALRASPLSATAWATLLCGIAGRGAVARSVVIFRRVYYRFNR